MTAGVGVVPYGAWTSPITSDVIAGGGLRLGGLAVDGDECHWIEGRALEGGRSVLVRGSATGELTDLTPPPYDVRTRVHEYGGGAYVVSQRQVWFVNFADQALYHRPPGGEPRRLTEPGPWRYADLVIDAARGRLLCVVEDHGAGGGEPENYLGAVRLADGRVEPLSRGHDFFSNPTLSPDGRRLAWLAWDHPRMPWDGTELWVAELDPAGVPAPAVRVAGGEAISVFQPTWSPDGELFYVADPDGWWNLYAWRDGMTRAVHTGPRELGRPQWVFGLRTYGFVHGADGARIVAAFCEHGRWRLGWIAPNDGSLVPIDIPFEDVDALALGRRRAFLIGGARDRVSEVAELDLASGRLRTLRRSTELALTPDLVSLGHPVEFPTSEGEVAYGYHYPPRNPRFTAPPGERPPLVVMGHGGPTGAASSSLSPALQFWTSRGFAVLDVNYRGSSGYGRAYRDRLKGGWGVLDVADCVHGARMLVEQGWADPKRLAIRGASAGGYTVLAALAFHATFTAGASYYGISELEALARDTHKFEARYLDQLIGPYPETRARYRARSPIHHVERLSCPVIFFQGLEDKVVPPNQAEMMVAALREKGLPVAYLAFEGEQHGFRAAATVKRALEAELYFYGRIFGFTPADELPPVPIAGLD